MTEVATEPSGRTDLRSMFRMSDVSGRFLRRSGHRPQIVRVEVGR